MDPASREPEQQGAGRLERCLPDVFRVPWEDLIYPQVISLPHRKDCPGEDGDASVVPFRESDSSPHDLKPLPFSEKGEETPRSREEDDPEGEYVELSELPWPSFSPQKGSLTQSMSLQVKVRSSSRGPQKRPPWATSQPSASPPAPSEDQSTSSCGGKTWMFANEAAGKDSVWQEEPKEEVLEEPVGGRKESEGDEMDEEQLAEVVEVEVEEEVQIRVQQNQDPIQEEEPMKEEEKKAEVQMQAGSEDMDSYCEKTPEQRRPVHSYSERALAPPAGSEGGLKEKKERTDDGAPAFTGPGTFFCFHNLMFMSKAPLLPLTHPPTTAPRVFTGPSLPGAEAAQPGQQSAFYRELLRSGAVCLPGELTPCCYLLSARLCGRD